MLELEEMSGDQPRIHALENMGVCTKLHHNDIFIWTKLDWPADRLALLFLEQFLPLAGLMLAGLEDLWIISHIWHVWQFIQWLIYMSFTILLLSKTGFTSQYSILWLFLLLTKSDKLFCVRDTLKYLFVLSEFDPFVPITFGKFICAGSHQQALNMHPLNQLCWGKTLVSILYVPQNAEEWGRDLWGVRAQWVTFIAIN